VSEFVDKASQQAASFSARGGDAFIEMVFDLWNR
jgi:hypothetical protein